MWRVLRAEFAYSRINYLVFLVFIPMALIFGLFRPSSSSLYIAWLMTFLMVNVWNASRIKEKREIQLAQLPITSRSRALVRVLMVAIPPALVLLLYVFIHMLMSPALPGAPDANAVTAEAGVSALPIRGLLTLYGTVILVFSLAFVFRDTFLGTRFLKRGKILLILLIGLGVAANIYAFIAFRQASETGAKPPAIVAAIGYLIENNPSTSAARTTVFLAVCLASALLSMLTFTRRRTHLE
ncbi:MAG: hypothetical protein PVH52_06155 [bacterium]|jgi:hypothetical protein